MLPAEWAIPEALRRRMGTTTGRQRVLDGDGHMIIVLHAPPTASEAARRGRFFWRDPNGAWQAAPKAEQVTGLDEHLAEYERVIERLEQAEESARQAREHFELLARLAPLVRSSRNMYDALQRARQTVPEDRRLIAARDKAYDLSRRAELLYEDAKNGLDFAVAWQAEQQAESSRQMSVAAHRLNVLAAFFFPIATLTTIFGANLRHGAEAIDARLAPLPLLSLIAISLVIGMILTWFVTRPAKKCPAYNSSSSSPTKRSK